MSDIGDLERSDPHQAGTCGPASVEKVSVPLEQVRAAAWMRMVVTGGVEGPWAGKYEFVAGHFRPDGDHWFPLYAGMTRPTEAAVTSAKLRAAEISANRPEPIIWSWRHDVGQYDLLAMVAGKLIVVSAAADAQMTAPTVTSPLHQLDANSLLNTIRHYRMPTAEEEQLVAELLLLREGMEKIIKHDEAWNHYDVESDFDKGRRQEASHLADIARSLLDATQQKTEVEG